MIYGFCRDLKITTGSSENCLYIFADNTIGINRIYPRTYADIAGAVLCQIAETETRINSYLFYLNDRNKF